MCRILHVDDCFEDRDIIGLRLQRREHEFQIDGVASVAEAFEALKLQSYDCILSDYQMPETNGLEFLHALRQGGDKTPFILVTGQGNEEVAAQALREGADDYYTKDEGLAHYDRLANSIYKLVTAHRNLSFNRELEASYAALFESIDTGVAVYEVVDDGEDFIFKNINSAGEKIDEGIRQDLIGRSVKELFPGVVEFGLFGVFQEVHRTGRPARHPISLYSDGRIEGWRENYVYKLPSGEIVSVYRDVTEQRNAREALRQSEERYRALTEHTSDFIWEVDADCVYTYVNPQVKDILGYEPREVLGKRPFDFMPPDEVEQIQATVHSICALHEPFSRREMPFLHADGRRLILEASAVPVFNKEGVFCGYRGIDRDVTESRKQALQQKAVYRISELTHTVDDRGELFSSIHDIVRELMPARNLFIALHNPASGKLEFPYFIDEQDDPPKPVDTNTGLAAWVFRNNEPLLIKPETFAEVFEELNIELQGTPSGDWLGVPLTTAGTTIGVLAVQSYRENIRYSEEDLRVLNFVSMQIASAIERHRTEKELRRSEWLFKQVAEICSDFSYMSHVSPHGPPAAEVMGGAFEEVTGYSRHEMRTIDNWISLIHPEDRAYFMETVIKHSRTGDPAEMEYRMVTKNGRVRWMREHTRPLWDDKEGRITIVVGAVEDITDDKVGEEELRESRDKLKRQSQQLELANQELETFAYTVSHDLKAPLRRINGWLGLLAGDIRDSLSDEDLKILDKLNDTSDQMKELIDSLLDLSRITRGELNRDEVDLSRMVGNAVSELAAEDPDRQVETSIQEGIIVRGDMRLLRAVVRNLVDNAWKFTRSREITRIEFFLEEQDGRTVYCMRDNGIGFDPEKAEKVFQPFLRLHSGQEYSGTGIGLATVRRIIHRHGGQVWAEGVKDQGACFRFTLD